MFAVASPLEQQNYHCQHQSKRAVTLCGRRTLTSFHRYQTSLPMQQAVVLPPYLQSFWAGRIKDNPTLQVVETRDKERNTALRMRRCVYT